MKKLTLIFLVFIFISKSNAAIITSNASEYFLDLADQIDPTQSITNEWQIGSYNGDVFELFDYSTTTALGSSSIVGWVNAGFHAAFLNISDEDEIFPGNIFEAGTLTLHPGQAGADIVLRYLVQQTSIYDIWSDFFALDTIESVSRNSDGVSVSVRINGSQLGSSRNLLGFGANNMHQVIARDIMLGQGDFIDFVVMPRANFFDDATVITASVSREVVSEVNEPTTLAMILFSLGFLLARRKV